MKVLRYFVAMLLLLAGVLHTLPVFRTPRDAVEMQMIAFGIIYFVLGLLLILKRDFSPAWGIIFPMIGLIAGFFVIGFQHWTKMLNIVFAIDAVVVICCTVLFLNKGGRSYR
jgi:uncharacterized membrane protein HdeD (DUF308 family)